MSPTVNWASPQLESFIIIYYGFICFLRKISPSENFYLIIAKPLFDFNRVKNVKKRKKRKAIRIVVQFCTRGKKNIAHVGFQEFLFGILLSKQDILL